MHLPGPSPHQEIPGALGWFDAGLVPATAGHAYLSPLKLPEYLASGLPVIVAAGSQGDADLPGSVKEVYTSGDPASLAGAVMRLRARPDFGEMGGRARKLAEGRTWDSVAATMAAGAAEMAARIPLG